MMMVPNNDNKDSWLLPINEEAHIQQQEEGVPSTIENLHPFSCVERLSNQPPPPPQTSGRTVDDDTSLYKCIFTSDCELLYRFHDADFDRFCVELLTQVPFHLSYYHLIDYRIDPTCHFPSSLLPLPSNHHQPQEEQIKPRDAQQEEQQKDFPPLTRMFREEGGLVLFPASEQPHHQQHRLESEEKEAKEEDEQFQKNKPSKRKTYDKEEEQIRPAPPPRKQSTTQKKQKIELYCICKQPNDPLRPMIYCQFCKDWFHFDCVDVKDPDNEFEDEEFACPTCVRDV